MCSYLPELKFLYNSNSNKPTKQTPFFPLYAWHPFNISDIILSDIAEHSKNSHAHKFIEKIRDAGKLSNRVMKIWNEILSTEPTTKTFFLGEVLILCKP